MVYNNGADAVCLLFILLISVVSCVRLRLFVAFVDLILVVLGAFGCWV